MPIYPLVRCPNCDVVYVADVPPEEAALCPNPECEGRGHALVKVVGGGHFPFVAEVSVDGQTVRYESPTIEGLKALMAGGE